MNRRNPGYGTILGILFLGILIVSLFVKAMYSFDDSPYFTRNNLVDYFFLGMHLLIIVLIYRYRDYIQIYFSLSLFSFLFFYFTIVFNILSPVIPFSDMGGVYDGALDITSLDFNALFSEPYFQVFPGNIKLSLFWGFVLLPLPKSIFSLRAINAILLYMISVLCLKIAKSYGLKYYNLSFVMMTFFGSWIMYTSVVYYEGPLIFLSMLALYMYKCKDKLVLSALILGLAAYFRMLAAVFVVAILCDYLLNSEISKERKMTDALKAVICYIVVSFVPTKIVWLLFIRGRFEEYPIWNQFYIGFNEAKFGFMDQDFSYSRNLRDILQRIIDYGPLRTIRIIIKKTFWLWTQGTFQAQRYVFGEDALTENEKFYYHSLLTNHLLNDNQKLRCLINSFLRAQYLSIFFVTSYALLTTRRRKEFTVFINVLLFTFLGMLIYELKSRYILHVIPIMSLFFAEGIERLERQRFLQRFWQRLCISSNS